MNTIIKLVIRDFTVQKTIIIGATLAMLTMGMFFVFINTNLSRIFISGANSNIIIVAILPFISELKTRNIWTQTASMPISRASIVLARLISSLSIIVFNLLLWVVTFYLMTVIFDTDPKYNINGSMILSIFMNILINISFFLFAFYRFNLIITMGFYIVSLLFTRIMMDILSQAVNFVLEGFDKPIQLSIIAISIASISLYFNLRYFKKKEL
ncbi:MAG: hypothetical protein HRT66_02665 [Flavobacteriaceae bacterium]|nr:hypothetical protein [Flavobacteriaceae bacterium]